MSGASVFTLSRDDGRERHVLPLTSGAWPTERILAMMAFVRYADAHPEMRLGQAMCEMGYSAAGAPSVYYARDDEITKVQP